MEELKDVILHVYRLEPSSANGDGASSNFFLQRMLPAIGMGAYHTSLEIDGYHYTFAAQRGICRISSSAHDASVPPQGATFQETIALGSNITSRSEILGIVKKLEQSFFTSTAYHLVHRNCNHFTQTLATAVILRDELLETGGDKKKQRSRIRLSTYPTWINKLASTSSNFIGHDDDIVPCNVVEEAASAVGANDGKVSWDLSSSANGGREKKATSRSQKKELTDKQKAILEKIRKK